MKQIAQQRKTPAGSAVSNLLRELLYPKSFAVTYRDGVPVLPRRPDAPVVTPELVNRLLNEDE
ncbi:MAG: CopG family transcriptional regulator [Acidobacteriota bacterium]|nr:CopG family transcriptional regulator [Acidobacteriota bacterium]